MWKNLLTNTPGTRKAILLLCALAGSLWGRPSRAAAWAAINVPLSSTARSRAPCATPTSTIKSTSGGASRRRPPRSARFPCRPRVRARANWPRLHRPLLPASLPLRLLLVHGDACALEVPASSYALAPSDVDHPVCAHGQDRVEAARGPPFAPIGLLGIPAWAEQGKNPFVCSPDRAT